MKTKRNFLSLLLAFFLVLGVMPTTTFAAENAVDTWDGTADVSWYVGNETASEYHITTAEQLAGFAALTNQQSPVTFTGKTIYLDSNLDLDGYEWTAISRDGGNSTTSSFSGTFDGQGHIIYNLNGNASSQRYGLFRTVYTATIKNINLFNANVTVGADGRRLQYGTLVSWSSSSTVENCYASGQITVATDSIIGGLIGQGTGGTRIIGCGVSVDVVSTFPVAEVGGSAPTVGGVIGQFENATANSLISDCYFSGTISVTSNQAGCGGILGAIFDFDGLPSITISNCHVPKECITCGDPDTITYIAAVDGEATVQHCFWPDVESAAVIRMIVDWDTMTAGADPNFDQSECGESVSDFSSADLIEKLNENAYSGVTWVMGKDAYPVFDWQENFISADYSSVDAAVEKANKIDKDLYSNYDTVTDAIEAVERNKSKAEQAEVDAMAKAIEDAIATLEYKDADYTKVDAAIAKANTLKKDEYKDFSAVEAAINAVVRDKNITEQAEVDAMAKAIEDAIAALEYKGADYSKVDAAIAKANALKKDEYKDFSAVEAAINAVVRGKSITEQAAVDAMAKAIEDAIDGLEKKSTESKTPSVPTTGDNSNIAIWFVTMLAAGITLTGTALYNSKKKYSK